MQPIKYFSWIYAVPRVIVPRGPSTIAISGDTLFRRPTRPTVAAIPVRGARRPH